MEPLAIERNEKPKKTFPKPLLSFLWIRKDFPDFKAPDSLMFLAEWNTTGTAMSKELNLITSVKKENSTAKD